MPWVLWITGLPGSGKSAIADALQKRFPDAVILGMDELRKMVTPAPDYSDTERDFVYRAIVFTAKKLYDLKHDVIIDATANRRRWRDMAREVIGNFFEIAVECPLQLCIERERQRADARGAPAYIYEKACKGYQVPGISTPYEKPHNPEIIINSQEDPVDAAAEKIMRMLDEAGDS